MIKQTMNTTATINDGITLEQMFLNTELFCYNMFPRRFYRPFNPLHKEIFDLVDARDVFGNPVHNKIVVSAPRGIGKTSIVNQGFGAKSILYRLHDFIVMIGASADMAILQSENLKRSLMFNKIIRSQYGGIRNRNPGREEFDEAFSKEAWVATIPSLDAESTYNGTFVLPRGSGQPVRGLLFGDCRPSLLLVDDVEDTRTIDNENIREERKKWFYADVMKCIDPYSRNWQIIYIDTLKHEGSLLAELLESPDWTTLRLSVCDENYQSRIPDWLSNKDIAEMVREHEEANMMHVFAMEMMGDTKVAANAAFTKEMFKYYEPDVADIEGDPSLDHVIVLDPARTTSEGAAKSAAVAGAFSQERNVLYFVDSVSGRYHPDEYYDKVIDMAIRTNTTVVGVEVTGLHEFITYPLKAAFARRCVHFDLIELKARGGHSTSSKIAGSKSSPGKVGRIAALIPLYKKGYIYHHPTKCSTLEQQLLSFPKSRFWDEMDAASYFVEMLDIGGREMSPDYPEFAGADPEEVEFGILKRFAENPLPWECEI